MVGGHHPTRLRAQQMQPGPCRVSFITVRQPIILIIPLMLLLLIPRMLLLVHHMPLLLPGEDHLHQDMLISSNRDLTNSIPRGSKDRIPALPMGQAFRSRAVTVLLLAVLAWSPHNPRTHHTHHLASPVLGDPHHPRTILSLPTIRCTPGIATRAMAPLPTPNPRDLRRMNDILSLRRLKR